MYYFTGTSIAYDTQLHMLKLKVWFLGQNLIRSKRLHKRILRDGTQLKSLRFPPPTYSGDGAHQERDVKWEGFCPSCFCGISFSGGKHQYISCLCVFRDMSWMAILILISRSHLQPAFVSVFPHPLCSLCSRLSHFHFRPDHKM
jgi:hypothetical protein